MIPRVVLGPKTVIILGVVLVASLLLIAYIIVVYVPMPPGGPPSQLPKCNLEQPDATAYTFVVANLTYGMEWNAFHIQMQNSQTLSVWEWEPTVENLTSPLFRGPLIETLTPIRTDGNEPALNCSVTDNGGDGGLSEGDFFTIDMDHPGTDAGSYTVVIKFDSTTRIVGAISFLYP